MGVYGTADPITTNQKVAGSSPAERAKNPPHLQGKHEGKRRPEGFPALSDANPSKQGPVQSRGGLALHIRQP